MRPAVGVIVLNMKCHRVLSWIRLDFGGGRVVIFNAVIEESCPVRPMFLIETSDARDARD